MNARTSSNAPTPADTIEELTEQCAALAASSKRSEIEWGEAFAGARGELEDCAGLFKCHMEWQGALMAAIRRIAYRDDPLDTEGLTVGDRLEIERLADIGKHLSSGAWSCADEYQKEAAT